VWSAWFNALEIYLSPRQSLLRKRGQALVALDNEGLSTDEALDKLIERAKASWPQEASRIRGLGMRFTLNAGLCPPVAFTVPQGLRNHTELLAVSHAAAAEAAGVSSSELVCELVPGVSGLSAALMQTEYQRIQSWVSRQNGRLLSLRPIWALASSCALASNTHIKCLRLLEPGQLTLVSPQANGQGARAVSVPVQAEANTTAFENRWFAAQGLAPEAILNLRFTAQISTNAASRATGLPQAWSGHWEQGVWP
jgi:hypothetical protein